MPEAVMMIGYGAPEKQEDVMPFLRNVAGGRPIPEERLREVASHYGIFGGRSPLNELTYRQAEKLEKLLSKRGRALPVYVGMRNWHPFIGDCLARMRDDGAESFVGLIMSIYRCDASWERYMRDIDWASRDLGMEFRVRYVPPLFDHPSFIEASAARVAERLRAVPQERLESTMLLFTAHSIPEKMADSSPYVSQFETSSRLVARAAGHDNWTTCYQSRSGSPKERWLEPDVCDVIPDLAARGVTDVVVQAIGFVCDHIEVLFDIGVEAEEAAVKCGVNLLRAETVNDDDRYIAALADGVEGVFDSENSGERVL